MGGLLTVMNTCLAHAATIVARADVCQRQTHNPVNLNGDPFEKLHKFSDEPDLDIQLPDHSTVSNSTNLFSE